jgi:hypothetical protein
LELVVECEPIFSYDYFDQTSIPESSNLVMAKKRTHSRAQEKRPFRVLVQNVIVDEDEDEKKKE